jgi:hypothetical protein
MLGFLGQACSCYSYYSALEREQFSKFRLRLGKSVQCSSDPEFAFFKCSSIILVIKLLRKQNNLQILLTGYEKHFVVSK